MERYLVPQGERLKLSKIDENERELYDGEGKEDHLQAFDALRNELQMSQKVQYAENKRRVLVVIQAMDTGGKDGCVKHVFSRVDPQGLLRKPA